MKPPRSLLCSTFCLSLLCCLSAQGVEGATFRSAVNSPNDGAQHGTSDAHPVATKPAAASDNQKADPEAQRKNKSTSDRKASASNSKSRLDPTDVHLTDEEQRAAFAFAEEHHPALASLVKKLRARDFDAYQSAILELHLDSARLVRMQERQPRRFDTEIALWKVDSEIRLQLARWAVKGDERSEKNVRRLLAKRQNLRRKRLASERERMVARLTQMNAQLKQTEEEQKLALDQEFSRLTKRIRSSARRQAGEKRPASKPDSSPSKNKDLPKTPNAD